MNQQDFYRKKYQELNQDWQDSQSLYLELIKKQVNCKSKILDLGCGHSTLLAEIYKITPYSYGIDPDPESLKKNTMVKMIKNAYAHEIPFESNFFDLVVSTWTLEHIEKARESLAEIYRVLKPGGKFIFLTPNKWNYVVILIRLIPNKLHDFFTKKLYGRGEGDTFPVRYKLNSKRQLIQLATELGFSQKQIIFNGDPSYISFNSILFKLSLLIEKLLKLKALQQYQVHLIGILTK